MGEKVIKYRTRDGEGRDIITDVKIKQYPAREVALDCPICGRHTESAINVKDIVSSSFTDWAFVGDCVCPDCADLFSLYFYSYIVSPDGIRLLNVRELRDALITPQKPPFLFCITTSRKKHLFYRAEWNHDAGHFAVNLEMHGGIWKPASVSRNPPPFSGKADSFCHAVFTDSPAVHLECIPRCHPAGSVAMCTAD